MGAFILGILVGWLLEWLFYNFWLKAGNEDAECSAIKAELELKNRQISSLQSQLASVSKAESQSPSEKKSDQAPTQALNKSASAKSTNKSNTAKNTNNQSEAKTATQPAVKKLKVKNTSSAKKTKTASKISKPSGDDFTILSGIGPSMSATLKKLGIDTFEKLAATDDDILRDMLEESGARMNNNKEAMDSWNEQATVAAKGDFKALKEMQAALKNKS